MQLAMAGAVPTAVAIIVTAVASASLLAYVGKGLGCLEGQRDWLWICWTDGLAILGYALIPFVRPVSAV